MSKRTCPRCNVALREHSVADEVIRGCSFCGGVWLKAQTTDHVMESMPDRKLVREAMAVGDGTSMVPDTSKVGIPCPDCGDPLVQLWLKEERVHLDRCEAGHGTWFDRDEVGKVAGLIQAARPPLRRSGAVLSSGVVADSGDAFWMTLGLLDILFWWYV